MSTGSDWFQKAIEYEKSGDSDRAVEMLQRAADAGFCNEHIHITRGRIHRERGEFGDAVSCFSKALDICHGRGDRFMENRLLNEIEISQKQTTLQSLPRGLGVVLTTECNLRCIMCNSWKTKWELPDRVVEEIIQIIPFLERVMWLGGEVFLSKHFERLFDAAAKCGQLHQTVVTNGILINDRWAEKLARAYMNLTYSIDGVTRQTYERIRRGARFGDVIASARTIQRKKELYRNEMRKERRMVSSINFVVMKSNYHEVRDAIEFAKEYGFDDLTLTPVDYVEGEENIFRYRDAAALKALRGAVGSIADKAEKYGITFHNWLPFLDETEGDAGHNDNDTNDAAPAPTAAGAAVQQQRIFCYWPWQHLFVDVGGAVKPHCLCHETIGNITVNTLRELWNAAPMCSYRSRIIENQYRSMCNTVCVSSQISRECMGILW